VTSKNTPVILREVKRKGPRHPGPCEILETCPVCGGKLEMVYERPHQKVCACADCHTTITVPVVAWDIARVKKKTRVPLKK
jgi:hypothetical protein